MKFRAAYVISSREKHVRYEITAPTLSDALYGVGRMSRREWPEPSAPDILSEENVRRFIFPALRSLMENLTAQRRAERAKEPKAAKPKRRKTKPAKKKP